MRSRQAMGFGIGGVTARVRAVLAAPWARNPRLGLGLIIAGTILILGVAFCGPSSVALKLGPRVGYLPPWYLPVGTVELSEWVAVPVLWLALALGTIGLFVCWRAVNLGWRPNNRRLFLLGSVLSVLTCLVPPMTSADVLMYAAYGRLQVLGLDPYNITPAEIFRQEYDPVLIWTERPWQDTPSVYGPLASASQWLAAWLGNGNMHDTVFWLQMFALLPFLVIGTVAVVLAHDNHRIQTRAILFTVLNPLMIWSVLAGAHNEAFTLVFAILGLMFMRRSPFLAGLGIGIAGTVKVSLIFYGIAMAWGYRRDWRKLLQLVLGAAIPLAIAYGLVVPRALLAAGRNTGYISAGSWAPALQWLLTPLLGDLTTRGIIGWAGWAMMVAVIWMLSRVMPWRHVPGVPHDEDPRRDPLTIAVRTAAILTAAWLVTSPYTLSWYDLTTWVPLGLMMASRLDVMMMWRGFWLSVAYVTGRSVQFSDQMTAVSDAIRNQLCSGAQILVLVGIVHWWWTWGRELPRLPHRLRGRGGTRAPASAPLR
ncbi:polyprenol phosphomannose-dependent alpha 1,6 mannosyltransferase MptB [Propionicimonas sp.]|uniref:polyprenol phosphomannose-dependent alpha 1,6 mannosyltransferase MptB n=1 Tax=Propionicimonas sp. TaxID=1955623 RepID=UPI0039E54695